MNDTEMVRAAAERVMGWSLTDRVANGWGHGPEVYMTGEDPEQEDSSPTFQGFDPLNKISHAWMLVEKLGTRPNSAFAVTIATDLKGSTYAARFGLLADGRIGNSVDGATAPRAITLAALKAVGVEV